MQRGNERLIGLSRCVDQEKMRSGIGGCEHGRRYLRRRFHRNSVQCEIGIEQPGEGRGFVDADFGPGIRMLWRFQDRAGVTAYRLVAWIAVDLHEGDLDMLLRW